MSKASIRPRPMMAHSPPYQAPCPTPTLGNLNADLRHGESLCTFGGTGDSHGRSSTSIEFVYGARQAAQLQRVALPLVCFDGASQISMHIVDVARDAPVASGSLSWKGRPAGVARLVGWSRRPGGDGILLCDTAGLVPGHRYRMSVCSQLLGSDPAAGFAPGLGLWGWLTNATGDTGGYIINDRPVPGLAPAWRIELSP